MNARQPDPLELARRLVAGDRRALAKAITLGESIRADHRAEAETLLTAILPHTGRAVRIGLSGPPGAGKSTLIEALGAHVTGLGHRIAVLAVDPSSQRTGGSILGDKTRMETLARNAAAFIRPTPSGGALGGVARRTREAILLVEAAGFDVVIVETVGVGQSETSVADMVDVFALLLAPGGGDELQGIKRGIMELADLVIVSKADGDLLPAARRAKADAETALHFMRPKTSYWTPQVLMVSAQTDQGLEAVWDAVGAHRAALEQAGGLGALRAAQAGAWFRAEVEAELGRRLVSTAGARMDHLGAEVAAGRLAPAVAARRLVAEAWGQGTSP